MELRILEATAPVGQVQVSRACKLAVEKDIRHHPQEAARCSRGPDSSLDVARIKLHSCPTCGVGSKRDRDAEESEAVKRLESRCVVYET